MSDGEATTKRVSRLVVKLFERTAKGRANRATFARVLADDQPVWWPAPPSTPAILASVTRRSMVLDTTRVTAARTQALGLHPHTPLAPDSVIHLGRGADVRGVVLLFILEVATTLPLWHVDAKETTGSWELDTSTVKTVVSQYGSRITTLAGLNSDRRQMAEKTLRAVIAETLCY